MSLHFSQFDGYSSSDFGEPFDYWNEFINTEFSALKLPNEGQKLLINCCVFAPNEEISDDEFLSDFIRKLPFFSIDNKRNQIVFWLLTPELLAIKGNNLDEHYDQMAMALLDNLLQCFSKNKVQENTDNFSDFTNVITNIKNKIIEYGIYEIRAQYKLKQEKAFNNKYWL